MKSFRLINKILAGLIIVSLFFLIVGVAYSYYVARLSGGETDTTITGKTGHMEFEYIGGAEITAEDIAPSTEAFITKIFTIKGTNTTDADMWYKISLIIDENTFSNNTISFTLTGTNTAGNGTLISNITERQGLGTENKSLGIGKYSGKINEGIHSYELKLYFYETEYDQLGDLGKTFKAHILIENYIPPIFNEYIVSLADNSSITGVYNEIGYRYEGANPNNYIRFNNELWQIIGVFEEESHGISGENLVKIIRSESIGDYVRDSGYKNNWEVSSLQKHLNEVYLNEINEASKSLIQEVTWKLGGHAGIGPVATLYSSERGTNVLSGSPTEWLGEIGLMYPSDYGYAVSSSSCSRATDLSSYSTENCKNNNWLYKGFSDWLITPNCNNGLYAYNVYSDARLSYNTVYNAHGVRPALYLKSNTLKFGGEGTQESPYIIME